MDLSTFGIAGVAVITVICYLIGQTVKASGLDNKWIPIIVGASGGALGSAEDKAMAYALALGKPTLLIHPNTWKKKWLNVVKREGE